MRLGRAGTQTTRFIGGAHTPTVYRAIVAATDDAKEQVGEACEAIINTELLLNAVGHHGAWRFTDLPIPQGSTIISAIIQFNIAEADKNDAEGTWYCHDADTSPTYTQDLDGDVDARTKTTASVAWTANDIGVLGDRVMSPNLAPCLQEVVDRPGWAVGNSASFIYAHNSDADVVNFATIESPTYPEPSVTILFQPSSTVTPEFFSVASTVYPTETDHHVFPDAILASTGLTGTISDVQNTTGLISDTTWLTTTASTNTDLRVSFPTPTSSLVDGAGLQQFRVLVRSTGEEPNPLARIELWENGSFVSELVADTEVSSTIGTVLSGTWNSTGRNPANIELRVVGTSQG